MIVEYKMRYKYKDDDWVTFCGEFADWAAFNRFEEKEKLYGRERDTVMLTAWQNQTIGVELTWLHPEQEGMYETGRCADKNAEDDLMEGTLRFFRREARKRNLAFYSTIVDGHCIEAPTPVMHDWPTFKKFYSEASKLARKFRLVPLLNNVSSGGGHVHIGVTDIRHQIAIIRDMCNRPYVSWAFLDPVDNETAQAQASIFFRDEFTPARLKKAREGKTFSVGKGWCKDTFHWPKMLLAPWDKIKNNLQTYFITSAEKTIYTNDGHLEFRCFAAANDWREQEEHVAFVLAYCDWVKKELYAGRVADVTITTKEQLKEFTYERCVVEFKELIEKIGLPWERYEHYTTEYLQVRFENPEWLV